MKTKKTRDWKAVSAHFRSSAGPMSSKDKKNDKSYCRSFNLNSDDCPDCGDPELDFAWEEFPSSSFSESYSKEKALKQKLQEEMYEYYLIMRPGDDDTGD